MSNKVFSAVFLTALVSFFSNTSFAIDKSSPTALNLTSTDFSYGVVEKQNDGSPNELRYLTYDHNFAVTSDIEFGKRNDFEAHGNYLGRGWQYAIIKVIDNQFNWIVNGDTDSIIFGELNDIAITGCDFNGDSLTDLAYLRDNVLYYRSLNDPNITIIPLRIVNLDSLLDLTCGDLNGDGIDDIATLIPVSDVNNRFTLAAYDASSGGQIFNKVVKKANQILITDFNNDGRNDLGFSRQRNIKRRPNQIIYHKNLKLRVHKINTSQFSEMTSYFDQDAPTSATVILKYGARVTALDPASKTKLWSVSTKSSFSLLRKTHFYKTVAPEENPDNVPEGNDICQKVFPANDGPEGFLWKGSDHDGRIVVLFPRKYRNFTEVSIMKGNEVLEQLYFSARANGNRQHWRGKNYPANFPNNSLVVGKRPKKTFCWLVENTAVRND